MSHRSDYIKPDRDVLIWYEGQIVRTIRAGSLRKALEVYAKGLGIAHPIIMGNMLQGGPLRSAAIATEKNERPA